MRQLSRSVILALAAGFVLALQSSPSANHSWNGYHWARSANPFQLDLGNNLSGTWVTGGYLQIASNDWSQSTVLNTWVVPGSANVKNCRPPTGRVEVCNSSYGNNGWVGIAQIWVRGDHITKGSARMNDYYFNSPYYGYNTPTWRQYVMCQEVGHTFGLGHQNEDFYDPDIVPGTCMDYTAAPSGNEHPNLHDFAQLETIYVHLDSGTTSPSSRAGAGVDLDSPSEWGRLMRSSRGGRLQVFERDFGNGQKIVTFVIWA